MSNLILLVICMVAGMAMRHYKKLPEDAHLTINQIILHLSLPAMIFDTFRKAQLDTSLIYVILMPWLQFGLALIVFHYLGKYMKWERQTIGALILTAGLSNSSFVGIPMIEAYYGAEYRYIGIIADQLGSFLVLATWGLVTSVLYGGGEISRQSIIRKVITFPPFIALNIAVLLRFIDIPIWLDSVFHRIGDTLAPLALLSVGLQLKFSDIKGFEQHLTYGVGFKLILAPLVTALILMGILGDHSITAQITVFEVGMGTMITGAIVASQHNLNPKLCSMMVGVSIILSFVTLPVIKWALST